MFISLLCLLAACCAAYRRTHVIEKNSGVLEDTDVRVKLWTWNSGKADLTDEAKRLAQTSADFIVTCQTEATKDILHFMGEEWKLLAHGEHWGAAGGSINAQMSSVFMRPTDGSTLFGNVSQIIGRKPWRSDMAEPSRMSLLLGAVDLGSLQLRTQTDFSAQAQVTALDYKGKGGVTTTLKFPRTRVRDAFTLQFVCAHLDSESDDARHYGIATMLAEARAPDLAVATALRKQAASKTGEMRQACALYDREFVSCEVPSLGLGDAPDAVLLFGDLNFRLSAKRIENVSESMLLDHNLREFLGKHDRLVASIEESSMEGRSKDVLVQSWHQGGFGFQCNEPFALYPPSYKRKGGQVSLQHEVPWAQDWEMHLEEAMSRYSPLGVRVFNSTGGEWEATGTADEAEFPLYVRTYEYEACEKMGKAVLFCGGPMQPPCEDWVEEMAKHCYVRKDKQGQHQWPQKKGDLQLGWLDRFCWRKGSTRSKVGTRLMDEEGWVDARGSKDKNGSDHMPVAATFSFTTVQCSCVDLPSNSNMFIKGCKTQVSSGNSRSNIIYKEIFGGHVVTGRCNNGFRLPGSNRQNEIQLKCDGNGKLVPLNPEEQAICKKECIWNERNWNDIIRQAMVEGQTARVSCKEPRKKHMLGVPILQCNKFGNIFAKDIRRAPFCAAHCAFSVDDHVVVRERRVATDWLVEKYPSDVKQFGYRFQDHVLSGGFVRFGCRNNCVSIGPTIRKCQGAKIEPKVKCACKLRLTVKDITFDPKLADSIEKVKFQVYRGPLQQDELEDLRENKGYEAAVKFAPEDLKSSKEVSVFVENPRDMELHLTLCSKDHSLTRWAFWRCDVVATSRAKSMSIEELLNGADSYDGTKDIKIPMDMHSDDNTTAVTGAVALKLEYHAEK